MNRFRASRKLRKHLPNLPWVPDKLPRLSKRSPPHTLSLLFLIPLFHLFRQVPHRHFYTSLRPPLRAQLGQPPIPPNIPLLPAQPSLPAHDVAPFKTLSKTLSSSRIVNASIDTVFICHYTNPCCVGSVAPGLRSVITQTVIPSSLALLHSCRQSSDKRWLYDSAKEVLNGHDRSIASLALFQSITDVYCPATSQRHYEECLLRYLSSQSAQKRYRLLLSDRDALEPTALEKMWMYLEFHSNVSSVMSLAFEEESMRKANEKGDPMLVKQLIPEWNHTTVNDVSAVPMLYRDDKFVRVDDSKHTGQGTSVWEPLIRLLSEGLLLREALYTTLQSKAGNHDLTYRQSMLSLQDATVAIRDIPPQLYSALAFYKWSSRKEESGMYIETFKKLEQLEMGRIATGEVEKSVVKRVMFLMPWMDMGGSEKAMLDLANHMLSKNWAVTFVLTMPNWREDSLGEIMYANDWLPKALSLSSDVINLVALAPNHLLTKAFRYILESRRPDIVFNSNTRWAYRHSALIRAVVPNAVVADYNHMIHKAWFGGGLPRYGANNSHYFDVHFTASKDVAGSMEKWIDPKEMQRNPSKVKPCYIGTDPSLFYTGLERREARASQLNQLNIPEDLTVILFAGRFVVAKGTDVMLNLVNRSNSNETLIGKLFFVFVGDGTERRELEQLKQKNSNVLVLPPAQSMSQMRNYYAMSDILLLPSVNEGIALVLYEAMASELLVLSTDVGGQSELVTPDSGILIPDNRIVAKVTDTIVDSLQAVMADPKKYRQMGAVGRDKVRSKFTTSKFCDCVIDGLESAQQRRNTKPEVATEETFTKLQKVLLPQARMERGDGLWKRSIAARSLHLAVTIGIKTYVCDEQTVAQVRSLLRSIRVNYPTVRVLLGNDGPASLADENFVKADDYTEEVRLKKDSGISIGRNTLVNMTTTKYFALLDDDHVFDDSTNLVRVVMALEKDSFDIVGLRIRNLPGIDELERIGISIPRYVSRIRDLENRRLVLCTWNENDGPSVFGLHEAIKVDVLHNAFVARTDVLRKHGWRDELEVNEHMSFFLDAWKAGVQVGYLPSEFVHHRARLYSKCYYGTRFREDRFRKLLDYDAPLLYDVRCGEEFPGKVRDLMGQYDGFDEDDDE